MPGERPRAHGDVDAVTAALPLSPRLPDAPVGALAHAAPGGDAPKAPGEAPPGERDDYYTMKTQPSLRGVNPMRTLTLVTTPILGSCPLSSKIERGEVRTCE